MNKNIRNFTIIAHVDHGKSTLADQMLIKCNAIAERDVKEQMLDTLPIEKKRGITIKAQSVRLNYEYKGENYTLNLIDTPGHSDFAYEVSRSLKACEISLLLIDATKGIQAQTLSTLNKAKESGHFIVPVLNKIDLPTADVNRCYEQIDNLGLNIDLICEISAKTGEGIDKLLSIIIEKTPCPVQPIDNKVRCLVFDSWYDKYLGVVTLVRIMSGTIKVGQNIQAVSNKKIFNVLKMGFFQPKKTETKEMQAGEIGFIVTQVKNSNEMKVGDTLIIPNSETPALEGFKQSQPKVFCIFYPETPEKAIYVHECLEKYVLNDSGFSFSIEHSDLYGMSFLCGFLGLLHLEIVKERLELEYEVFVTVTIPSVIYKLKMKNGEEFEINNPNKWPSKELIDKMYEPEVNCKIFTNDQIGPIMNLCINSRANDIILQQTEKVSTITCKVPLSEIILSFDEELKSRSSGYASFEYEICGYREGKLNKLIILVNGETIKEFGLITHESKAVSMAKSMAENLKNIIPRQQVAIKIQVAVDTPGNIIARTDISAYKKDVIAKCYGGDITRKKKLLEKQKSGKKNLKVQSKHWILSKIPNNAIKNLFKLNINN